MIAKTEERDSEKANTKIIGNPNFIGSHYLTTQSNYYLVS
jgi:hypothetical protein